MSMTKEERVVKLTELRAKAEKLCKSYNEAVQTANFSESAKLDEQITNTVNEYTSVARDGAFEHCKNTGDPMLEAVKVLSFSSIAVKDEKTEDDKIPVRGVIDREKPIDLLKLNKFCGGIGATKEWAATIQKFNLLLTCQKAVDLGISPKAINDSYAMSDLARQIDLGKTPTSKTNILKTLQTVVTAMLGDGYKATSHDVNYLLSIYSKKNRKALSVTCANHTYLTRYMAEVCHRIVTGESYEVVYKAKKEG